MNKRLDLLVFLFLGFCLVSAGCRPEMKMVSRPVSGSATLTPFLPKATFTPANTPVETNDEAQMLDLDLVETETQEKADLGLQLPATSEDTAALSETKEQSQTVNPSDTAPTASALPASSATETHQQNNSTSIPPSATNLPPAVSTATDAPDPTLTSEPPDPSNTPAHPSATPVPPPTNTTSPQPTATPVPAGCNYSGNSGFESQVIELINQERSNRGLAALTQNNQLRQAARGHSQDMACNDFFSHTGSDGSSMGSRILAAGYSYSWAAENIAASSSGGYSPQSVVSGWMNSTGHRKNILNENAKHIGIGYQYVSDGDPGDLDAYYTANFGRP